MHCGLIEGRSVLRQLGRCPNLATDAPSSSQVSSMPSQASSTAIMSPVINRQDGTDQRVRALPGAQAAAELSIVVPTYNERENVPVLVERLRRMLGGVAWEIIVVDDDSPDGTAGVVKNLA